MSTVSEISVAAVNAGEANQPKPRWMPLEGNPEVKQFLLEISSSNHSFRF